MASFLHRLTCLAMTIALLGSPAVLAVCAVICMGSPAAATTADAGHAHHRSHVAADRPAAESSHAHHATDASTQPAVAVSPSPLAGDAHLVGGCINGCLPGTPAVAIGPGVERPDSKAPGVTLAVDVVPFRADHASHQTIVTSPPVPAQSPGRAPLPLRI